jgi:hypothetical protein
MNMTYAQRYRNTMTEDDLLANLRDYAKAGGWAVYHTHNSRRSEKGFPDVVAVRGGQLAFIELKSASGRIRPEQKVWLAVLRKLADYAPGVIFTYVWRPADLEAMRMFFRPVGTSASWSPVSGPVELSETE